MTTNEKATEITRQFAEAGKVIEGGWQAYLYLSLSKCPEIQKMEMRKAFYFGAQHVFFSILTLLEPGQEATENDMKVIDNIHTELEKFVAEIKAQSKQ